MSTETIIKCDFCKETIPDSALGTASSLVDRKDIRRRDVCQACVKRIPVSQKVVRER